MGAGEALLYVFILFPTSTTLVFFILFFYRSDGHISGSLSNQTLSVGYILPFCHTVSCYLYFCVQPRHFMLRSHSQDAHLWV